MSLRTVGIDLGTANSLMACINASGHSEMLRDREGKLHVPSVVLFDDDRVIVGQEAKLRGRSQSYRLAACAKQDLGKHFYTQPIGGQYLAPEVIQACILRHLKEGITQALGNDFAAVIGVPAYFNDIQRRATAEAADMAGLPLLDVLNEPVAAALAFGEHRYAFPDDRPASGTYVLVYDLGGYTFEATLLRCEADTFTTLATDRDNLLGGNDWDLRLADCVAEKFRTEHGIDLHDDPADVDLLFTLVSRAKIALGIRSATSVMLPRAGAMRDVRVTREEFERLTAGLLERTVRHAERVLIDAGLAWTDISRILLVGGATRMPMVRRGLRARSGQSPEQSVSPDEAVCRGAAIFAGHLLGHQAQTRPPRETKIGNISTHSLGIEGIDPKSGKKLNRIVIPRGTKLPARVSKEFVTKANAQRSISITVLEGDSSQPQHCTPIGRAVLRELPEDLTIQWPVEVTCEYGPSGRLTLDARIRYTDRHVHLEVIRPCGVSQVHLERWRSAVGSAAGFAEFESLARRELRDHAPPPIALAISPPEPESHEGHILTFLHRFMPFIARRAQQPGDSNNGH